MSEADGVAESIYAKDSACWPLTRKQAEALVWVYCKDVPEQMKDNIAGSLMELNQKDI